MQLGETQLDDQLDRARQQATRYCYDDGFVELALGVLFAFGAVLTTLVGALPNNWVGVFIGVGLMFALATASQVFIDDLRERVTYIRSGYVQAGGGTFPLEIIVAVVSAVLIIVGVRFANLPPGPLMGAALALFLGLLGYRVSLLRLAVVGGLGLLAGILTLFAAVPAWVGLVAPIATVALGLLVSGGITLLRYLNTYPEPH